MALVDEDGATHVSIIVQYAEILYKCRLCYSVHCLHRDRSAFVQHVRKTHLSRSAGSLHCTRCNLSFINKEDLNHHTQMAHLQADEDGCQQAGIVKRENKVPLKKIALDSYQLMQDQELYKPSSDSLDIGFDCIHGNISTEASEGGTVMKAAANVSSRKRAASDVRVEDNNGSLVGEEPAAGHPSIERGECFDSIISSMKAECAMLGSSTPESHSGHNSILSNREELEAIYGRYASTIRIKDEPYLYCQVCMYKTNMEDDFRIHFMSNEHWETVSKMEQATDQNAGQNTKLNQIKDPSLSLSGSCSSSGKKPRYTSGVKKAAMTNSSSNCAQLGQGNQLGCGSSQQVVAADYPAVSSCKSVVLPSLTQLDILSEVMTSDSATFSTTSMSASNHTKTENDLTSSTGREHIVEKHLKELLEEHSDGRLSYNCLLEMVESYVEDQIDIVELGVICDSLMKKLFPSAQVVHLGPSQDLFYSGVRLKYKPLDRKKTTQDIGLTGQIFDILPDLVSYTGNLSDSVPRAVILNLLSTHFNQPEVLYWGPQCNKAIQALFPNMEIRRKGKSKATHFYGICLKTEPVTGDSSCQVNSS